MRSAHERPGGRVRERRHLCRRQVSGGDLGRGVGWPTSLAGEIAGLDPRALVEDRKLHRLLQRSDLLGLYVAGRALDDSGFVAYRETLEPPAAAAVNDRTGVYVGLGGGSFQNEYEFFPLLTTASGDLGTFGRELTATVNPM